MGEAWQCRGLGAEGAGGDFCAPTVSVDGLPGKRVRGRGGEASAVRTLRMPGLSMGTQSAGGDAGDQERPPQGEEDRRGRLSKPGQECDSLFYFVLLSSFLFC